MAIDDPLSALDAQLASEDRASDPTRARFLALARLLPSPWPVDRLVERLQANRLERIELLAGVLEEELRRQQDRLDEVLKALPDPKGATMGWFQLVEDGFKKAETIRSAERVRRIGAILMNALVTLAQVNPDEVEELMRVAVDLSDTDVVVLREFVRIEGIGVTNPRGRMERYDAHSRWDSGAWGSLRISEGDLQSICSKLEAFGLVTRIAPPNNLNITADFENRYALLQKGQRFVEFVKSKSHAGASGISRGPDTDSRA